MKLKYNLFNITDIILIILGLLFAFSAIYGFPWNIPEDEIMIVKYIHGTVAIFLLAIGLYHINTKINFDYDRIIFNNLLGKKEIRYNEITKIEEGYYFFGIVKSGKFFFKGKKYQYHALNIISSNKSIHFHKLGFSKNWDQIKKILEERSKKTIENHL